MLGVYRDHWCVPFIGHIVTQSRGEREEVKGGERRVRRR